MNRTNIAVLLSWFNRKQKTLACLEALFNQALPANVDISAYIVDDASTDGTSDAVRQTYLQVKIFSGDGNLFWNGGMHGAFSAMKDDPDYYLWLKEKQKQSLAVLPATTKQVKQHTAVSCEITLCTPRRL
jgi:GT2 family glycosyltransferase